MISQSDIKIGKVDKRVLKLSALGMLMNDKKKKNHF